ncbi:hypothetical protein Hypma_002491 [Hypsizygus marmoreus]|uniref:Uncharacterized protein n=1 Tax=Hypsizygus marmoreus TaxID=39966 RepID=A0A369JCR8_HYPMA|nr:hypothetical protein Hypma_002491 [Hypsizygus marmoreus]
MNGTGVHFHPPKHDVFGVAYPKVKEGGKGLEKVWETDVLLIPVFLGEGVKVRMDRVVVEGEGGERPRKTLGTFDGVNTTEMWFVKFETKVKLVVEGSYEDGKEGTAVVMAVGILCRERHDES